MTAHALPAWRRHWMGRLGLTALLMLPALLLQWQWLDASLPLRLILMMATGTFTTLVVHYVPSSVLPRPRLSVAILDALLSALVVTALWPMLLPLWMLAVGLSLGLLLQRFLGGRAISPFPVPILALVMGISIARVLADNDISGPLLSLISTAGIALAWLVAGILLLALRLRPAWASLGFLLPTLLVWSQGGIAASALLVMTVISIGIMSDPRGLPVTRIGQFMLGILAGLGTALLWHAGAPPVTAVYPVLLVYALSPWIEQRTLPSFFHDKP